ncbi:MAG TPA: PepSY domain-containing protein [Anaerolineales bacterium]|nr:PepSY domain-containing protein [Anaerolineales bacterium]
MKINRYFALAAIALLVVAGIGVITTRSFAAPNVSVTTQAQTCNQQDNDIAEVQGAPDTGNVDLQCGEQVEDGQPDGAEGTEASEVEAPGALDTGAQDPSYVGSVAVDQAQTEGMSEDNEAAALQGKVTLSVADAETAALAANPGATVVKTELDNENGALVYSVELSNGADVKVDAGNATILFTDSGADNEG